jgi:hypothetical protein
VLEDAAVLLPVEIETEGVLVIPEFGGMLVGVYLTPLKFVQDVNLAVALPVIFPGVMLLVGVQ